MAPPGKYTVAYDLTINSARMGIEGSVQLILAALKIRGFIELAWSLITAKGVTSLPVPAVAGIAIIGREKADTFPAPS